ncbi:threonine/serine exporter family protein, partial [Streptomyces cyaneofuscatus]
MVAESGGPEDQKPQSDEARSAFVPPAGTMQPVSPPEEDHPTSEFAIPTGVHPEASGSGGSGGGSTGGPNSDTLSSAFTPPSSYNAQQAPPAFTPATGIPMVRLTK